MLAKEVILHGFDKLLTTSISGFLIIRLINMVIEVTDNDIISPVSTGEISY